MTYGGRFAAGTTSSPGRVQQRIRQYAALEDEPTRLRLAKALVHAKVEMQLKYLLRCTRGTNTNRSAIESDLEIIRGCLRGIDRANAASSLLGYEGNSAQRLSASTDKSRVGLPFCIASSLGAQRLSASTDKSHCTEIVRLNFAWCSTPFGING